MTRTPIQRGRAPKRLTPLPRVAPGSSNSAVSGQLLHDAQKPHAADGAIERATDQAGRGQSPVESQRVSASSGPNLPASGQKNFDPQLDNAAGGTETAGHVHVGDAQCTTPGVIDRSGGGGHFQCDDHAGSANPDPILVIRGHQRRRVATMKAQLRIGNQVKALVRAGLGSRPGLSETERVRIRKTAAKIIKQVLAGESVTPEHASIAAEVAPFCLAAKQASAPFDALKKQVESVMVETAAALPVAAWVASVRGFGLLGLAIVVGEAGDLSKYANPGKLWKRLGLAPAGCYRMTCADGSEANAIPRRRRSAIWTVGDSLLKGNADGPYRAAYLERKAYEHARDPVMTKMHAHRRAQRYAEKRLLRDLWRAWRDALQQERRPAA